MRLLKTSDDFQHFDFKFIVWSNNFYSMCILRIRQILSPKLLIFMSLFFMKLYLLP